MLGDLIAVHPGEPDVQQHDLGAMATRRLKPTRNK
jgi:hypothetical protein